MDGILPEIVLPPVDGVLVGVVPKPGCEGVLGGVGVFWLCWEGLGHAWFCWPHEGGGGGNWCIIPAIPHPWACLSYRSSWCHRSFGGSGSSSTKGGSWTPRPFAGQAWHFQHLRGRSGSFRTVIDVCGSSATIEEGPIDAAAFCVTGVGMLLVQAMVQRHLSPVLNTWKGCAEHRNWEMQDWKNSEGMQLKPTMATQPVPGPVSLAHLQQRRAQVYLHQKSIWWICTMQPVRSPMPWHTMPWQKPCHHLQWWKSLHCQWKLCLHCLLGVKSSLCSRWLANYRLCWLSLWECLCHHHHWRGGRGRAHKRSMRSEWLQIASSLLQCIREKSVKLLCRRQQGNPWWAFDPTPV